MCLLLLLTLNLFAEEPPGIVLAREFAAQLDVEVVSIDPNAPDRGLIVRSKKNGRIAVLFVNPNERTYEIFGMATQQPALQLPNAGNGRASDKQIANAVRQLAAKARAAEDFSGVVLVARGDRIVIHEGFGVADRDHNVPVEPLTKFQIASCGKMFTATAIMQLIDAGKLTLDTTLLEVLPDYPNREVAAKIRVRHLLNHSAGLGSLFDRPKYDRLHDYEHHSDHFPIFAGEPLLFEPGARSSYSNEGYIVLGAIIEKLSGLTWDEYMQRNVFAPAGMQELKSWSLDEVVWKRAVGYRLRDSDPFGYQPRRPNWTFVGLRGNAAGGQYGHALDLFRFLRALRANKLASAERVAEFITHQPPRRNYGFGFTVKKVGEATVIGHTGGGGNSGIDNAAWMIGDWTVVVQANYEAAANAIADRIVEALAKQ
ncbi:MAG TPA: serine hydrolase domain-containing protein [Thermoanaerobaculia bacterium]